MKLLSLSLLASLCCIACSSLNASFFFDDHKWQEKYGRHRTTSVGENFNFSPYGSSHISPAQARESQSSAAAAQPVSQAQVQALAATVAKAKQKNQRLSRELEARQQQQRIQEALELQAEAARLDEENKQLRAKLNKQK